MASPSCPDPARAPAPVVHHPGQQSPEDPRADAADGPRPTLVGDSSDGVAFLDGPGVSTPRLLESVADVLARMPDGAILTVFTDDRTAPHQAAVWVAGRGVEMGLELLAVIPHDDRRGTTLTFRRAAPGSGSDATGPPDF